LGKKGGTRGIKGEGSDPKKIQIGGQIEVDK
jgi:hypothetical protein